MYVRGLVGGGKGIVLKIGSFPHFVGTNVVVGRWPIVCIYFGCMNRRPLNGIKRIPLHLAPKGLFGSGGSRKHLGKAYLKCSVDHRHNRSLLQSLVHNVCVVVHVNYNKAAKKNNNFISPPKKYEHVFGYFEGKDDYLKLLYPSFFSGDGCARKYGRGWRMERE